MQIIISRVFGYLFLIAAIINVFAGLQSREITMILFLASIVEFNKVKILELEKKIKDVE